MRHLCLIKSRRQACTTPHAAVLSATVFLGMLLGGLYTGVVSDIIGRKPMLLLSLAVNAGEMRLRVEFAHTPRQPAPCSWPQWREPRQP